MEYLVPLVIIFILILLNGLFVAAEFAIIGAPRTAMEHHAANGNRVAQKVREILHDPRLQDQYIATAQLGITFASLGLGMYGEHEFASWLAEWLEHWGPPGWIAAHSIASLLSIAILTYLHIVLGEMVPKSLALLHAEQTVLWITRPMLFIKVLLYPLVIGLNGLGNGILRMMGIRREFSPGHFHSSEELQYIVQESQQGGLLRSEQGQVLRDLFMFVERTAREVMVPRVRIDGIRLGATAQDLRETLQAARRTRYPVFTLDLDHIMGVIHIKDVLRLLQEDKALEPADVRPLAFVPETMELDGVLEAMRRVSTQLVVVMDEHGGTAGIISIEDLCVEIVGEFEEGSDDPPDVRQNQDGHWVVSGETRLDEVGELLNRVLEHPEVDTVSGLVLALIERPPVVGDIAVYEELEFRVTAIEGFGVRECTVIPVASVPDDAPEG